jgi:cell division protein FtsI/penicillin-binding protein 2
VVLHDRTYASFIGVADFPARRIVVLVGIVAARGDLTGGKAAAPVFARLVTRMLAK